MRRGILGALIGVVHHSRRRLPPADGLLQRRHRYCGGEVAIQRPTDGLA
jgi:hypothetical protein